MIVEAFQAGARFSELLSRVDAGEEIVITRHGRPVARLVPVVDAAQQRAAKAVKRLRDLRQGALLGGMDWRELRDAGRR